MDSLDNLSLRDQWTTKLSSPKQPDDYLPQNGKLP